jgi:hypothetical protein
MISGGDKCDSSLSDSERGDGKGGRLLRILVWVCRVGIG